jgi:hypothetical protein
MARSSSTSGDAAAPNLTIAIPLHALPAVTVAAPPPALITKRNAAHVGMSGPELVRVLRAMRADPRFREDVIAHGKSYRAAPPEAIVAYLRSVPAPAGEEGGEDGDDLLRELGYERKGTAACAGAR